jgi:hypothetical protein
MPPGYDGPAVAALLARALEVLDTGGDLAPADLRALTKGLARSFAAAHPGRTVELRIPPYVAVQCLEGPRHTRGTPPNVVETDPLTWLLLCAGRLDWAVARREGRLSASGERADLSGLLPHSA